MGGRELPAGNVTVLFADIEGLTRLIEELGEPGHQGSREASQGGQIVMSAATRVLVDDELAELGEHHLKDFDEPVSLFQLGSQRFPPLKTISNTNFPRPASSFVGRARERDELLALLRNG